MAHGKGDLRSKSCTTCCSKCKKKRRKPRVFEETFPFQFDYIIGGVFTTIDGIKTIYINGIADHKYEDYCQPPPVPFPMYKVINGIQRVDYIKQFIMGGYFSDIGAKRPEFVISGVHINKFGKPVYIISGTFQIPSWAPKPIKGLHNWDENLRPVIGGYSEQFNTFVISHLQTANWKREFELIKLSENQKKVAKKSLIINGICRSADGKKTYAIGGISRYEIWQPIDQKCICTSYNSI